MMRRKRHLQVALPVVVQVGATGDESQIEANNQERQEEQAQQQQQEKIPQRAERAVGSNLIVMKMLKHKRTQVIRIKLTQKTSIMQLFIITISLAASCHLMRVQSLSAETAASSSSSLDRADLSEPTSDSVLEPDEENEPSTTRASSTNPIQLIHESGSTKSSGQEGGESMSAIESEGARHISDMAPGLNNQEAAGATEATGPRSTTISSSSSASANDDQETPTSQEPRATTVSSFVLDDDHAGDEPTVTSDYSETNNINGHKQSTALAGDTSGAFTTTTQVALSDQVSALLGPEPHRSRLFEAGATVATQTASDEAPTLPPSAADSQNQPISRSRKSSPEQNKASIDAFPSSEIETSSAQNQSVPISQSALKLSSPSLDYDDFDLDYQLKLGDGGDTLTGPNLNKRDYDNTRNVPPTPPPWSALIGQHLFNSSASPLANESQLQAPASNQQHYQHAPPIMPSLLTIKSTQLTSQELNKVRPQFLFYPDQYGEFGYANGGEISANGDLLATATNLNEQRQRLYEHLDSIKAGVQLGTNTSAALASNLSSSADSRGQTASSSTAARASAPTQISMHTSNSGPFKANQMISLLNGSPLQAKQANPLENLSNSSIQVQPNRFQTSNSLSTLNNNRLQQKLASDRQNAVSETPQVTTIIVDNSTPTETPSSRIYVQRTTTFSPLSPPSSTMQPALITSSTSTVSPVTPSNRVAAVTSAATVVSAPAQSGSNSSHSNQWFNYPHPNLHHNPLLLHHILNKSPTFYAQNLHSTTTAQPAANTNEEQSVRTTTITSVLPQVSTASNQATHLTASDAHSLNAPAATFMQVNTIESPTYGASNSRHQQPVNMTLLQMQLDEMRAIAAKNSLKQSQASVQNEIPGRDNAPNGVATPHNVPANQQASHFRFVDQTLRPLATAQSLPWRQESGQQVQDVSSYSINMLHPLMGKNFSPTARANLVVAPRQPLQISNFVAPTPLASQVIAAPSVLQEVYTPGPPVVDIGKLQNHDHHQADSIGSPESVDTNATRNMTDEDMSTYVALLASLSAPTAASSQKQVHFDQQSAMEQNWTLANGDEQRHLAALLQQLQERQVGSTHKPDGSTKLELLQPGLGVPQRNQLWPTELMRGARLIGLSDEVQSQIYRDFLTPMAQMRRQPVRAPASLTSWPPPFIEPVTKPHSIKTSSGPMEGSEAMRSFASMPPAAHVQPQLTTGLQAGDLSKQSHSSNGHTERHKELQLQLQLQQQKQIAFIEAIKSSLSQLHEATKGGSFNGTLPNKTVGAELDESEEGAASTGGVRPPLSDWHEKPASADAAQLHELAHMPSEPHGYTNHMLPGPGPHPIRPALAHYMPQSWLPLSHQQAASVGPPAPLAGTRPSASRFPIPIYPLRSLLNGPRHQQAGPQPRLLWPVQPGSQLAPLAGQLAPASSNRMVLATSSTPPTLIRLNAPMAPQVTTTSLPLLQSHTPPPLSSPLHSGYPIQAPLVSVPNKIMLERFPLTAAPAYLVKLPTLTGGTITASGSLVAPQKFLRRPPAAFVSATPLGALRFLSALTPPRMRLVQPTTMSGPASLVQPASSMLHVHHAPIGLGPASSHFYHAPHYTAHLHPIPHLHHQAHHQHQHQHLGDEDSQHLHAIASQPPARLQIYVGSSAAQPAQLLSSPAISASSSSHLAQSSADSMGHSMSSQQHSVQPEAAHTGSGSQQSTGSPSPPMGQQTATPALTRLQQATASLVELTSLASLLDEMVGGNEVETSPAVALANAINSLSAAQNAALSAQASSSSGETARVPQNNHLAGRQLGQLNQQQQLQNFNQHPASLWRNLFAAGFWRGQQGHQKGNTKLRDLGALERLLAHATAGGVAPNSARLKVKYIRVPVAVYETGAPNFGDTSLQLATLAGDGSQVKQQAGEQAGGSSQPSLSHEFSTSQAGESPGTNPSGHTTGTSSGLSAPSAPTSASGNLMSQASSSSSNEYLFDEMSSESGPQVNYMLNQHREPDGGGGGSALGYLPIVRAAPKGLAQATEPSAFFSLTSGATLSPQTSLVNSLAVAAATAQQEQLRGEPKTNKSRSKRKRKKKRKKAKKGGFLLGGDDDDDDDEYEHHDDNETDSALGESASGNDDDDDALSANDLPIIESLISTIFHGAPSSLLMQQHQSQHYQQHPQSLHSVDNLATAASGPSGWRSARAHLRPFGIGSSRNRFNQAHLLAEPSSQLLTYAHPATGLVTGGQAGVIGGVASNAHRNLLNPFSRQRFSLGEVVGALGAKKLISSLLGRRKSPARTNKRVAAASTVAAATAATTAAAAIAVTPASLLNFAFGRGVPGSGSSSRSTTTRAPTSQNQMEAHNNTAALMAPWRRRNIKINWPKSSQKQLWDRRNSTKGGPAAGGMRHKFKSKHRLKQQESATSPDEKRFVLGDDLQPLVYPAIAAYESDSFAKPARPKLSQPTRSAGANSSTRRPGPLRREAPQTPTSSRPDQLVAQITELEPLEGSPSAALNRRESLHRKNVTLAGLENISSSYEPPVHFDFVFEFNNRSTSLSPLGANQTARRQLNRHKTNSRGPDDLEATNKAHELRPRAADAGGQQRVEWKKNKLAMPLYHVVGEHHNKLNAGQTTQEQAESEHAQQKQRRLMGSSGQSELSGEREKKKDKDGEPNGSGDLGAQSKGAKTDGVRSSRLGDGFG